MAGGCVGLIRGFYKRRVQRAHKGVQTELVHRRTPVGRRLVSCSDLSLEPRESPKEIQKVSHPFTNNDDCDGKTPEKILLLISHILESADFKDQMTGCFETLQSSVLTIFT